MKESNRMFHAGCALALAGALFSARADVWRDCAAWYFGGKGEVGAFANGDMTDVRHAAVADAPTHGGATRANEEGISNLCESVYSAASGRTFADQRTIYLTQREGVTASGAYGVYENGVALPFAATNENYTLLMRVKLDEAQPHVKDWVYVADMGYSGGDFKYAFSLRYNSTTEQLGVLYNNASNSKSISPTNDVCTTLRGKWLEVSVSLEMLANGKSRMRFGVAAEGMPRTYGFADYKFPTGQSVPIKQKMYLAGVTGYGGVSTKCSPARGSYQMVAYWERVLTDDEILAAFRLQGPDGTPAQAPALLKVGDPTWNDEVFGGVASETVVTPSLDLQDLGKFPLRLAAGQTLNLPFTVPATCTNLRQVARIAVAAGTGTLQVALDGAAGETVAVDAGKAASVAFDGAVLTEGQHLLILTRRDAGAEPLKFATIELSGSWRLGWIDGRHSEMGGDAGSAAVKQFAVTDLTTNDWSTLRSTVKRTRHLQLVTELNATDVAQRRFVFRAKPHTYPAQKFDYVILANDREVYRRVFSTEKPYADARDKLVSVSFRPGELPAGTNVITVRTEINAALDPAPSDTWVRHDYFSLEVGTEPPGSLLILK